MRRFLLAAAWLPFLALALSSGCAAVGERGARRDLAGVLGTKDFTVISENQVDLDGDGRREPVYFTASAGANPQGERVLTGPYHFVYRNPDTGRLNVLDVSYPTDIRLDVVYRDVDGDQNPEIFFSQDVPASENPENRPQVVYFDRRERAARVTTPGDPAWPDQPRLLARQAGNRLELASPAWEQSIVLVRREGAGLPYSPLPAPEREKGAEAWQEVALSSSYAWGFEDVDGDGRTELWLDRVVTIPWLKGLSLRTYFRGFPGGLAPVADRLYQYPLAEGRFSSRPGLLNEHSLLAGRQVPGGQYRKAGPGSHPAKSFSPTSSMDFSGALLRSTSMLREYLKCKSSTNVTTVVRKIIPTGINHALPSALPNPSRPKDCLAKVLLLGT